MKNSKWNLLYKRRLDALYQYWLFSGLHLILMKWKNRRQWEEIRDEDRFYKNLLSYLENNDGLIFDIGANYGWTTMTFLSSGCKVIAYEPDSNNLKILHNRFKSTNQLLIKPKAISNNIGYADLYQNKVSSALNTLSFKWVDALTKAEYREKKHFGSVKYNVETTTLDYEIKTIGKPVFLKVDVEGHEKEVFEGLSSTIPLIIFEANLPEFTKETVDIIERLVKLDRLTKFNYSYNYRVMLDNYISGIEMIEVIKNLPFHCVDVISRSSEYETYFKLS